MNSSTNLPPKNVRKFQFDTDFDQEEELSRVDAMRQVEQLEKQAEVMVEDPVELAPTFTEDEMTYAREEGFRVGYEQATNEARHAIETSLANLVIQMNAQMDHLLQGEAARLHTVQTIAVQTTIAVIKKIWPSVISQFGLEMVTETIKQSFDYNPEEGRIVVRVHDTMLDAVIQRLPDIQGQKAFAGKVIVLADQGIGPADCKVEWADGGMERLSRDLSSQLDSAMERILALVPQHDLNS